MCLPHSRPSLEAQITWSVGELWVQLLGAGFRPSLQECLQSALVECSSMKVTAYLSRVLSGTGNAFETTASAKEERMKIAKRAELRCPQRNDLVTVIAEATRPTSRNARNVLNSAVYARCAQVQCGDAARKTELYKCLVQGENVIWVQTTGSFTGHREIEIVTNPSSQCPEPRSREIGWCWRRCCIHGKWCCHGY